ncbi:MAG: alpha/beta hydrolase-fold protein [bacterium]|nr:alpha/beta hydrolase-fold protein [bacterium]
MKDNITWQDYHALHPQNTVDGALRVAQGVYSPQLDNKRDILVWLPPTYPYEHRKRYPVLYFFDGQNLFDSHTSYAGEWHVDSTMIALAQEGIEAIIVGLPNNDQRHLEYNPFEESHIGRGKGDKTIEFIAQTIKPMIDRDFRTRPDRAYTGLGGSSMGGGMALFGYLAYPHIFGLCAALSPAYWFGGKKMLDYASKRPYNGGRMYLDVGTAEGSQKKPRWSKNTYAEMFVESVQTLTNTLVNNGYTEGKNIQFVLDEGGTHSESAWARRLPNAMRFLLG